MAEVVTGEAVVLDIPCASYPTRIGALLIDLVTQLVLLGVVLIIAAATGIGDAVVAGIIVTAYVVVVIGYPTAFETLTRGRTPGKMALGLRVISDDGSPVRFRQALVRALTGVIEIWSWIGAPVGLITSIISAKGKRLGDIFAGTYVISERVPQRPPLPAQFAVVPPPLLGWAQVAEIARLSDHTAEAASSYLRRLGELSPAARDSLGLQLAGAVAGQVSPPPPPGTPPAAYLAAVLAVRRQRDQAWLASARAAAHAGAGATAAPAPAAPATPVQQMPAGAAPARPASSHQPPAWAAPGQQPQAPAWTAPGQAGPAVAGPPPAGPPPTAAPRPGQAAAEPAGGQPAGPPPPGPAGFAPPA
ncbi:MAG TPA: RDD family protein [Streptosporangiaceae bacterium]|nr:RDD family protein [Streptosporangiaceae bacterium]